MIDNEHSHSQGSMCNYEFQTQPACLNFLRIFSVLILQNFAKNVQNADTRNRGNMSRHAHTIECATSHHYTSVQANIKGIELALCTGTLRKHSPFFEIGWLTWRSLFILSMS